MGCPGAIWNLDIEIIKEAIIKAKGRVTYVCKALNVHPRTLQKRVNKEPELAKLIDDCRNEYDLSLLDVAENCLMYAMSQQASDLPNALKAAFFVLNNKGKHRGYSAKNNPNFQTVTEDDIVKGIRKYITDAEKVSGDGKVEGSKMEVKQSILDKGSIRKAS